MVWMAPNFNIYRDGQIVGSDVTQNGGIIEVKDVTKGLWSFVETEAPEGYCADSYAHQRLCGYHRWRQAVHGHCRKLRSCPI